MMPRSSNVISIQSQVVHGHVGNSAAMLPMQVRGLTVAAVPTTLLSNNPHFDTMRGRVLDSELVGDLLRGVEERGLIEASGYIVSGYLGSRANGDVVAAFVERARRRNPDIVYICDPVMGDAHLGVFVADAVVACILEKLVPLADVIMPNQFEAGLIGGGPVADWAGLKAAIGKIAARAVVTGCVLEDTPLGLIETVVLDGETQTRLAFPRLPIVPVGTGDLLTGIVTANLADGLSLVEAARDAAGVLVDVLGRTVAAGQAEMRLADVIEAFLPRGWEIRA